MAKPCMDPFTAAMIADGEWSLIGEEPTTERAREAWQYLHDTGLAYQLQGRIGRTARDLIEAGEITE